MGYVTVAEPLRNWMKAFLNLLLSREVLPALAKVVTACEKARRAWKRSLYHGMYEILSYESTLEIVDSRGDTAVLRRRAVIRFLQDNVVAIHDHAWGDGQIFADYSCQPGTPVDFYKDGSKFNVLISLRETKNRDDIMEFWVERTIRQGLLQQIEWLETEIDHWTKDLRLSIIFPKERPCRRATVSKRSTGKASVMSLKHFALLPDGRQKLTWETKNPKLHDRYSMRWVW